MTTCLVERTAIESFSVKRSRHPPQMRFNGTLVVLLCAEFPLHLLNHKTHVPLIYNAVYTSFIEWYVAWETKTV